MQIEPARPEEAPTVVAVLHEAAQWLVDEGRALWSGPEIAPARIERDCAAGGYFIARIDGQVAGVVRLDLEDPYFWPEIEAGGSLYVHKLAVRRGFAGQGVSNALLVFARERATALGRRHLRLDCVADRAPLRRLYERFGFALHSEIRKDFGLFARYELPLG